MIPALNVFTSFVRRDSRVGTFTGRITHVVQCGVWMMLCGINGLNVSTTRAELRVSAFETDVSPALGTPVAYAPARSIADPISARGIVLTGAGQPIVLCAVDYLGIGNTGNTRWRESLAAAVGTSPQRVAIHTLHQHDGPRCDFAVEQLLAHHGLGGKRFDVNYCREAIEKTAAAAKTSLNQAQPVTHLGLGKAKVERVASNRRLLGPDGKVAITRWSRSTDPAAIAAPEGLIDPWLRCISLWNDEIPLAVLTYYATHPQSYYGDGDVTCEFVGIARNQRQSDLGRVIHTHFNGAGGNITAGKYNDGSVENRPVLAGRMQEGMRKAWEATEKTPLSADDVEWSVQPVLLPVASHLDAERLNGILDSSTADDRDKLMAAKALVWLTRCEAKDPIELSCLRLANAYVVHAPGELFIEYQLAAQDMLPEAFVAFAAYGDYSPGYIGTKIAYTEGGYEVREDVSRVAPETEAILLEGIQKLLKR